MKFPKLSALFGRSDKDEASAISDEQMAQAEARIAQLEGDKTTAETALATTQATLTTTKAALATSEEKAATLEKWKKEQQAVDGRQQDESNALDDDQAEALAPWEKLSAAAIATAKKRVGAK